VLKHILSQHDWIQRFDVLVWSYQLGIAKPDAEIYRHTLERLGTQPEETLFIDDKRENVEAARALGIRSIEYSSVEQLRAELIANGLGAELPLPG
jgi:putative hydrolase of the HAD superfamily